jgi:hypothetical protein
LLNYLLEALLPILDLAVSSLNVFKTNDLKSSSFSKWIPINPKKSSKS